MSYYPETVASKMQKGLKVESEICCEINKALRNDGKSRTEINYYLNMDSDFISDVIDCYKNN